MRCLAILAVVAGCSDPPLKLSLDVADADATACGGDTCDKVKIACDAVASIRIIDPSNPTAPLMKICQNIDFNKEHYLCSLAQIDLLQTPLPVQTLEVQVIVYPRDELYPIDPTKDPICPGQLDFDGANGFPLGPVEVENPDNPMETRWATPAIGGRGFYHPGDSETIVALGCPDLAALNKPTCQGTNTVHVTASVIDFDTNQPVSPGLGTRLAISIGEPTLTTGTGGEIEYVLNPADTEPLEQKQFNPIPGWGGDVPIAFQHYACLEVLDTVPAATATLSCSTASMADTMKDITGSRLSKETLADLLLALGNPTLDKGITIGIVLDDLGPSAGHTVTTTGGTIRYLSQDGTNFNAPATTASGIFVSEDAPFGTQFTTTSGSRTVFALGGRVDNKVTIVPLRFTQGQVGKQ